MKCNGVLCRHHHCKYNTLNPTKVACAKHTIVNIAGGGVFLWQQSKITSVQNDLQALKFNLQNQTAQSQSEKEILKQQVADLQFNLDKLKDTPESKTDNNSSVYCTKEPTPTEIGRDIYPINIDKYGNIGFLGELFTADDCGSARVSLIFGVNGNDYTLWPVIQWCALHTLPLYDNMIKYARKGL